MNWAEWDKLPEKEQWRHIEALLLRTANIVYGNVSFRIVPDRDGISRVETREMRETFKDHYEE